MNIQAEALKLKVFVEHLDRTRTLENAVKLLHELKSLGNVNLQFIQDFVLTKLLVIIDSADNFGKKLNEFKTVLIQCINIIISKSKIINELPYRTILCIITQQIYDRTKNAYLIELSEELKMAIFDCLEIASRNLDFDVIDSFMVKENQIIIGQCLFVCKEAIMNETYMKIRIKAVKATIALTQCHDNADISDIVLREKISKIIFVVLPKISTTLIKVCGEDTLRGPHLIQVAVKCLGRFLTLIFYDYAKRNQQQITKKDFLKLLETSKSEKNLKESKTKVINMVKSDEWLQSASKNLLKIMVNMKALRHNEYKSIRHELAVMSFNMIFNCSSNIEPLIRLLLENLIVLSSDSDQEIQSYSQDKLSKIAEIIPNIDHEISELFILHLNVMPRVLMTGMDGEKSAGISLLNSYIKIFSSDSAKFDSVLSNFSTLEKFLNILTCCCELETSTEFISFETTVTNNLDDQFYNLKMPWKKFRHLCNDASINNFSDLCKNLSHSKSIASLCVNFILDRMNSIEHVVCLIEILACDENSSIEKSEIENIFEDFLADIYWNLPTKHSQIKDHKKSRLNEQWFKDNTPGLYESAIEIRLFDKPYNKEDDIEDQQLMSLKILNYNTLCTCIIIELTGKVALKLKKDFHKYLLRCLHQVLKKAGSSNFLIKSAGLYALNCIKEALGYTDLSQLIDDNANFLLFNIQKMLKHRKDNESILDMLSIIFKYSKTSINEYIDDIVEMVTNQITSVKNSEYHLKLFELYMRSVKSEIVIEDLNLNEKIIWDDFLQNCFNELDSKIEEENIDINQNETDSKSIGQEEINEDQETLKEEEKLPLHIEIILRILNTSLPFFASKDQNEIISTHEIFRMAIPILQIYEKEFLPMIHKMWYPFTKQFQGNNFVILQHSFELLTVIAHYAKDFIYKKSIDKIIPIINEFLKSSYNHTNSKENFFYTQEFKLQKEILSKYGKLSISLGVDDKEQDDIISLLILYMRHHFNDELRNASKCSLDFISHNDPMLIDFKLFFE
ncbi:hypothetical protein PVAND_003711 [Polypedilum vanderplanki]|uniref:Uncharacterized protein n=1 Tax=Polypedilum vanderplanki TaxID=319348 RepID=A0A9J6BWQ4_POLVA|nr:hypothetical protein PVAND_003711 [Polypedilum vanderplanki]